MHLQSLCVFSSSALIENMGLLVANSFFSRPQGTIIVVLHHALWILSPKWHFRGLMNFPLPHALLPIFILLMDTFLPCYLQQEPVDPANSYVVVKRNSRQSFRKSPGIIRLKNSAFTNFCTSYLYLGFITESQQSVKFSRLSQRWIKHY